MCLNDTTNEPSQTQAEGDNSFVCYVNGKGVVETDTKEPMSLWSFCRSTAECIICDVIKQNESEVGTNMLLVSDDFIS